MNNTTPTKTNLKPEFQALLGVLPFLAYGPVSILSHFVIFSPRLPFWLHPFLLFDALVLIGLGAGILAGFPRWTYSYLFWSLILTWWLSGMTFFGHRLDERMWLLPLAVFVLTLLVRRSLAPLRTLLTGLWSERTLLAFGMYSFFAWVGLMYDENHHPYLLVFILASTLVASAGAWFYFRQATAIQRVLSMVAGSIAMLVIEGINSATWDWRAYYGLPEGTSYFAPILAGLYALAFALVCLPGLISPKYKKT